jgi:hypothetical protein
MSFLRNLRRLRNITLLTCIFVLFACAKTQVKTYPTEPLPAEPPVKTSPIPPSEKPYPMEPTPSKTSPIGTYTETVSKWRSYQDVVRWMEKDFSFDIDRFKKFEQTLPLPRTSEETFRLKSGIYIDAVAFIKETLNRIDSSYKAQIVVIIMRPYNNNHYVCSFRKDGKMFIMDYGTPYKAVTGIHGPYNSLEEYKKFYEKYHPIKRKIEAITYLP